MDETTARRSGTDLRLPTDPREAVLEDLRKLDPGAALPGPWVPAEEIGARLLSVGRKDPERVLRHLVTLFRPAVEEAVREELEREAFVLDVAEVALRVFARLHRCGAAEAGAFRARLRSAAREAIREDLFPDPLEPPLLGENGPHGARLVRAAQAAFNRLPRAERVALRGTALEGRSAGEVARALGVGEADARETLRRARKRFADELRRLLADAERRVRGSGSADVGGGVR
ncbi:MAG TPA: sigma factor-like helix-turn-helix DNA-binding protein [Planctomycetota bacterium]|jgi:DNA-directed RNA polymerase specialized sigma24 family protein|nr:sigma factor-like helix-turn-helix DNA-binding protein [Planctomycetota bacterium]